jgi:hypothetical protein
VGIAAKLHHLNGEEWELRRNFIISTGKSRSINYKEITFLLYPEKHIKTREKTHRAKKHKNLKKHIYKT